MHRELQVRVRNKKTGEPYQARALYKFRCLECLRQGRYWSWPPGEDPEYGTTSKAPLEVRLHIMAHNPEKHWSKVWSTPRPRRDECPSCGFALDSWKIPAKPEPDEEDA